MQRIENMALINCPECGPQMSDTSKKWPNCGYKINKLDKKLILGFVMLFLGLLAFLLMFPFLTNWGSIGKIPYDIIESYCGFGCLIISLILIIWGSEVPISWWERMFCWGFALKTV